jgi:hypothetical protein
LADLAPQWIINENVSRASIVAQIENDQVGFFASEADNFYLMDPFFQRYLEKCFEEPVEFPPVKGEGHRLQELWLFPHRKVRPCH